MAKPIPKPPLPSGCSIYFEPIDRVWYSQIRHIDGHQMSHVYNPGRSRSYDVCRAILYEAIANIRESNYATPPKRSGPLPAIKRDGYYDVPLTGRDKETGQFGKILAYAKVDAEDVDRVSKFRWTLSKYALSRPGGKSAKSLFMHRFVLDLKPSDPMVDHVNRDKLDNRKQNLRCVTSSNNLLNIGIKTCKSATSGYRNVYPVTGRWRWIVMCQFRGIVHHDGPFVNIADAVVAAYKLRRKHAPSTCIGDPVPIVFDGKLRLIKTDMWRRLKRAVKQLEAEESNCAKPSVSPVKHANVGIGTFDKRTDAGVEAAHAAKHSGADRPSRRLSTGTAGRVKAPHGTAAKPKPPARSRNGNVTNRDDEDDPLPF